MTKTIVVTGGGGLLGSEIIKKIATNTNRIIYLDIRESVDLKEYARINNYLIEFKKLDVTSAKELDDLSTCLVDDKINIVGGIHCAYPRLKSWGTVFEDLEENDIYQHLNMQLGSAILFSKFIVPLLKRTGQGGSLIHLSSIYGIKTPVFNLYDGTNMITPPLEYGVIKAGIIHLVRWLAKYSKGNNIRVNCISPGGIYDNQPDIFVEKYNSMCTNIGMLNSKDIASVCAFLLSDESRAINGQNLVVDDGWSL